MGGTVLIAAVKYVCVSVGEGGREGGREGSVCGCDCVGVGVIVCVGVAMIAWVWKGSVWVCVVLIAAVKYVCVLGGGRGEGGECVWV